MNPPSAKAKRTRKLDLGNSVVLELVRCPAGAFMMGSPENEPGRKRSICGQPRSDETQHRVVLTKRFWMGMTVVTQAQWVALTGDDPSPLAMNDLPVEHVSWDDAMAFCRKLTERARSKRKLPSGYEYRLPTEAEWEYACRAESAGPYAGTGCLDDVGWHYKKLGNLDNAPGIQPVAQKQPNAWGLYDMHGNVYEWCQDWYGVYPAAGATDPLGPGFGEDRVIRGGESGSFADKCRSAYRSSDLPETRRGGLGFRVVLAPIIDIPLDMLQLAEQHRTQVIRNQEELEEKKLIVEEEIEWLKTRLEEERLRIDSLENQNSTAESKISKTKTARGIPSSATEEEQKQDWAVCAAWLDGLFFDTSDQLRQHLKFQRKPRCRLLGSLEQWRHSRDATALRLLTLTKANKLLLKQLILPHWHRTQRQILTTLVPLNDMLGYYQAWRLQCAGNMAADEALEAFAGATTMELRWCPAGTFTMGSPAGEANRRADEIQHQVTLSKPFWIGKTELTRSQWQTLMTDQPRLRLFGEPDDPPMEEVSWDAAVSFCQKLTERERADGRLRDGYEYRLPTEAEWEYACRAGRTGLLVGAQGNEDRDLSPQALAREQPNPWGLYILHGNSCEWCRDWYGEYSDNPITDPAGPETGIFRTIRGGHWIPIEGVETNRVAFRGRFYPNGRYPYLGFRVALAPLI